MNTRSGMETLLRRVAEHVDPPCDTSAVTEPFAFSVNSLGVDPFIGRLVTGKVYGGIVKPGAKVHIIKRSPDVDDDNDGIAGGGQGGEEQQNQPRRQRCAGASRLGRCRR